MESSSTGDYVEYEDAMEEVASLTAERDAAQEALTLHLDSLGQAVIERDKWEEDARTRAQNTDFWRGRCDAARAERDALKEENAQLLTLAGRVIADFPDYMGIDGYDCQDMSIEAGLLKPVTITDALLDECDPDNCQCRHEYGPDAIGETCNRITPLGHRARAALEGK